MKKINGLTLVELMIAITLSFFVLFIVTEIYIETEKNFTAQSALANLQENAQIALELLQNNLRTAGYIGCAKLTKQFPIKNVSPYEFNDINKITIEENNVTIRQASITHAELFQTMRGSSTLYVTSQPRFAMGDILLIADCSNAEMFVVKKIVFQNNLQKIVTTDPLSKRYEKASEVSRFEINTYFIDKTNRKTRAGEIINALYVRDIHQRKTELVEGIDNMQIALVGDVGVEINLTVTSFPFTKKWYRYIAFKE